MQSLQVSAFSKYKFSYISLLICAIAYMWLVLNIQPYKHFYVIKWDVYGYYLYLPSIFIYDGLKDVSFSTELNAKYNASDGRTDYGIVKTGSGEYIFKFTAGLSILYLPFFLLAHFYSSITEFPADGLSMPYQFMIAFAAIFYAILGLTFIFKILKRYFADKVIAATLLLIAFGTNYYHYVVVEGGMAHVFIFALVAMLIYFSMKWHNQPQWKYAIGIGITAGLSMLIRPSEFVLILIPLLWGVSGRKNIPHQIYKFKQNLPHILVAAIIVLAIGSIQLIYWKAMSGNFIVDSYKNEGFFDFTQPHIWSGLFSYKKGWFIYTPLMLFSIAGIFFLRDKLRHILPLVILFLIINIYVVLSWNPWWYGGSFGLRAFIESYALLSLPLAAFNDYIFRKKWLAISFFLIFLFLIFLNINQSNQRRKGIMHWENMTKEKYWDIFFRID